MADRKLSLFLTPNREGYFRLTNQIRSIIESAPVDVVITTVDDWKKTRVENLSIEDLKQNQHVQGLLDNLKKCASNDDFLETRQREFTMTAIVNWTKSSAEYMFLKAWNIKSDIAKAKLKEWESE